MKKAIFLTLVIFSSLVAISGYSQDNAAPSIHMGYDFAADNSVLKSQKIKIVQTAKATFFEVNTWQSGYTGLQDTNDTSFGTSNIFISSMWDFNTAAGLYSRLDYNDPTTFTGRFGGEGDGTKTINPYNWKLNNWYTVVNRSWSQGGRLYVATFIKDDATGKWFHTATFSLPTGVASMTPHNGAFLENWNGTDPALDGKLVRKAFFKDVWNLTVEGKWDKPNSVFFSANDSQADVDRNGIYHNSFNAYYDTTENAYCMAHGGDIARSPDFNGGRTLVLPVQTNQGSAPVESAGVVTTAEVVHIKNTVTVVTWTIDPNRAPQLETRVELINDQNKVVASTFEIKPEKRSATLSGVLPDGNYTARITMLDIFNQSARVVDTPFTVSEVLGTNNNETLSGLKVYPNPAKSYVMIDGQNLNKVKVADGSGRIVLARHLDASHTKVDVSHLSKGGYVFIITDLEGKSGTKKIVIK